MLSRWPGLLQPHIRYRNARRVFSSLVEAKASAPLRILFCGSDQFSCLSLKALHREYRNGKLIESLDVMVRPGKPTGRGLKTIREVPLMELAKELGLSIHERDTFTGWELPRPGGEPINLIVAVSFGLFVPPRILRSARYGGLNVHPSLLPDLRGPAPLHHALLRRRANSGVSLQTLSEESFDAGTVLAQTARPGIPIPESCTVPQLHDLLAPAGADMLVDGLRRGVHVPPHVHVGWIPTEQEARELRYAPKTTPAYREVQWTDVSFSKYQNDFPGPWTASDMALRHRVLGRLWTHAVLPARFAGDPLTKTDHYPCKRLIFEDVEEARDAQASSQHSAPRRTVWLQKTTSKAFGSGLDLGAVLLRRQYVVQGESIIMPVSLDEDHGFVKIGRIKVEGEQSKPAALAMQPFTLPEHDPSADWPVGDQNRNRFPCAHEPADVGSTRVPLNKVPMPFG